nr:hypothetical protein Iba_chr07aCG5010 [Ipomoea batatas]
MNRDLCRVNTGGAFLESNVEAGSKPWDELLGVGHRETHVRLGCHTPFLLDCDTPRQGSVGGLVLIWTVNHVLPGYELNPVVWRASSGSNATFADAITRNQTNHVGWERKKVRQGNEKVARATRTERLSERIPLGGWIGGWECKRRESRDPEKAKKIYGSGSVEEKEDAACCSCGSLTNMCTSKGSKPVKDTRRCLACRRIAADVNAIAYDQDSTREWRPQSPQPLI